MLDKTKTYLILNYSSSAIAVPFKDGTGILIPGGSYDAPASLPVDINDIHYINNATRAFKIGLLWFEPEYASDIYEELRIRNPESILTDKQIECILRDPTVDGLELLMSIEDAMYFERIYGVYIGVKNAGYPISAKVNDIMSIRRNEVSRNKIHTDIVLRASDVQPPVGQEDAEALRAKISESDAKIAEMQAQMDKLMQMLAATAQPVQETKSSVEKPKTQKSKTPSKKTEEKKEA